MTGFEKKIWRLIKKSKKKGIKIVDIIKTFKKEGRKITRIEVRNTVRDLVNLHGKKIGGDYRGYSVLINEEQRLKESHKLRSQAHEMLARALIIEEC